MKNRFAFFFCLGLLVTAVLGCGNLFENLSRHIEPGANSTPPPRAKTGSPLGTADISEISFTSSRYEGLLYGDEKNRSVTSRTVFRADGSAFKIDGEINYEKQVKVSENVRTFRGSITGEQFKKLARTALDNDFLNEPDARDRITDATDYRLKIKYANFEKEIITSNTGRDSPEIDAILRAFKNLQSAVSLAEEKQTP